MNLLRIILGSIYLVPITICSLACSSVAYADALCEIDEYSLLGYFVKPDKTCGDLITSHDVYSIVKIVDQYWDWSIPAEKRFTLLTKNYQDSFKKIYGLKDGSEFARPIVVYGRSWHGYKIEKIQIFGEEFLDITMDIKWSQEGYQGETTFIFSMLKIDTHWEIAFIAR